MKLENIPFFLELLETGVFTTEFLVTQVLEVPKETYQADRKLKLKLSKDRAKKLKVGEQDD